MTVATAPPPASPDEVALAFLDELYAGVEEGWVTLFSLDRTDGSRHVDWARADALDELAAAAIDRTETGCVWFGVATRRENLGARRGGVEDCAVLPALWVDVDVAGPGHAVAEGLPRSDDEALTLVGSFPLPPTVLVHTGGGYQAWWFLQEPLTANEAIGVLRAWGATWQQLAERQHMRVDNVFNVDRVMRIPGSLNRKVAGHPRPVVIVSADYSRRYGLDDLSEHFIEAPAIPAGARIEKRTTPYIGPERPGDAWNVAHAGSEVLAALGFTHARTDRSGDEHWTGPWKEIRDGTSATVYGDDGHTTVWSDSARARWPALELRRPYDAFGLLVATTYAGDFQAATADLRRQGYGSEGELPAVVPPADGGSGTPIEGRASPLEDPSDHGWNEVDLATILDEEYRAPLPTILARTDGDALLYAGRVNGFNGESGSGKSWAAVAAVAEQVRTDHHVLYIDFEDHVASLTGRLLDLGVGRETLVKYFHYVQPENRYTTAAALEIEELVERHGVALVVIDSVGEAMAMDNRKQNDDDDVARWFRLLPRRLANLGAAVVLVDHVPKAKDAPLLYAIGSQRKRAAIDGVSYRVEQVKALGRGRAGTLKLTCAKDRNGHYATGTVVAEVHLDATGEPTTIRAQAPVQSVTASGDFRPTVLMEKVSRVLEINPGLSANQIEKSKLGRAEFVRTALGVLIEEGYVVRTPKGAGFAHESARPFRDESGLPEVTEEEEF